MDDQEKIQEITKNRGVRIFIAILFVVLLVGSVAIFIYQKERYSNTFFEYNGFAVHKVSDKGIEEFVIEIFINENKQSFTVRSRHNPNVLEDIDITGDLKENIIKKELYVTMDPSLSSLATIAFAEINKFTENPFLFNLPTLPGLIFEADDNTLPVIDCYNVSEYTGVVKFEIEDENRIYIENGCVILESANEEDLIKVADRLSLTLLGIMEP